MTKYRANISSKNIIELKIFDQGVSSGKLKFFGPHWADPKKIEFARGNPLVDNFRSDKICLTYICLHRYSYLNIFYLPPPWGNMQKYF